MKDNDSIKTCETIEPKFVVFREHVPSAEYRLSYLWSGSEIVLISNKK